jgi:hypothetical protein
VCVCVCVCTVVLGGLKVSFFACSIATVLEHRRGVQTLAGKDLKAELLSGRQDLV